MISNSNSPSTPSRSVRFEIVRTLLVNALAPYLIYALLKGHTSNFIALVCSGLPPLIESVWSLLKRRRLDVMAVLVLGGIALGLGLMAMGGNARLLLVRESLVTGLVGVVFLVSLVLPRPIIFYLAREMTTGDVPEAVATWDRRWQDLSWFRAGMRVMTLMWGAGMVVEAAVRVDMAETLPIQHFLAISPFVQYGITGALVLWTLWYRKRMKQRAQASSMAATQVSSR
ncbi:VC0807 family protein [Mangrovitalea sediminis]|uniref:VC0807 family protein n=1 Tax=Mangrovitalea sediminis TaxID=1982043 RepID=UPI000BE54611|nr:VC0807 family protein [Mangrovitalea sediminis]